ncbi:MAG: hypothetical protein Tsb0020_14130 [Haliangiales bacterium]
MNVERVEQAPERLLDRDRDVVGERRVRLGDEVGQPAGRAGELAAQLVDALGLIDWERHLLEAARQQRGVGALLEHGALDLLHGVVVGGAALGRAGHEIDRLQARHRQLRLGLGALQDPRRARLEELKRAQELRHRRLLEVQLFAAVLLEAGEAPADPRLAIVDPV